MGLKGEEYCKGPECMGQGTYSQNCIYLPVKLSRLFAMQHKVMMT